MATGLAGACRRATLWCFAGLWCATLATLCAGLRLVAASAAATGSIRASVERRVLRETVTVWLRANGVAAGGDCPRGASLRRN